MSEIEKELAKRISSKMGEDYAKGDFGLLPIHYMREVALDLLRELKEETA